MDPKLLLLSSSTAEGWPNISGASYDSVSLSHYLQTEDTAVRNFCWANNGSEIYFAGDVGNNIYRYTLSSPYVLSTASYSSSTSISALVGGDFSFYCVRVSPDGTRLYVGDLDTDTLHQFSMTAHTLSSLSLVRSVGLSGSGVLQLADFIITPDGDKGFVMDPYTRLVEVYTFGTNWEINTASNSGALDISGIVLVEGDARGLAFNGDGTRMYICGGSSAVSGNAVYQFSMATPWDVLNATYDTVLYNPAETSDVIALAFDDQGTKMFLYGDTERTIYQYSL